MAMQGNYYIYCSLLFLIDLITDSIFSAGYIKCNLLFYHRQAQLNQIQAQSS